MPGIHKERATFLHRDGTLKLVCWAENLAISSEDLKQILAVDLGPRPSPMVHSTATGQGLVSNGFLGVDVIRLASGEGFAPHTHSGDHLLIVVGGKGTITYNGCVYPTEAGQVYLVEGSVPHAVGAITDHVILAVGAPHKPVDSAERMTLVEYEAVTAELGSLQCLICNHVAQAPQHLHDVGCAHCPCGCCP
jgi:quercetin dioxygenase-like cupin family protein